MLTVKVSPITWAFKDEFYQPSIYPRSEDTSLLRHAQSFVVKIIQCMIVGHILLLIRCK
jgi:hypothetical protein